MVNILGYWGLRLSKIKVQDINGWNDLVDRWKTYF